MIKTVNLKEIIFCHEDTQKILEIEIANAKAENINCIKLLHGYGSHGIGGSIYKELKLVLPKLKKNHCICDYIYGEMFNFANPKVIDLLKNSHQACDDCDLNKSNYGITIIII